MISFILLFFRKVNFIGLLNFANRLTPDTTTLLRKNDHQLEDTTALLREKDHQLEKVVSKLLFYPLKYTKKNGSN